MIIADYPDWRRLTFGRWGLSDFVLLAGEMLASRRFCCFDQREIYDLLFFQPDD